MKNLFPILAAVLLAMVWGALYLAIPSVLSLFADFKVQGPFPTMALLWFYHLLGGWAIPLIVLVTALLLGFQRRLGWFFGLVMYALCDLGAIGLVLPIISLINNLAGEDGPAVIPPSAPLLPSVAPLPIEIGMGTGAVLAVVAFLLNQALLVVLLVKRRDFGR